MSDDSKHRPTANDTRCWDCAADPTARLEEMFVELIQRTRIERGQRPKEESNLSEQQSPPASLRSDLLAGDHHARYR